MKFRVTLLAENDKHIDLSVVNMTKAEIEHSCALAWSMACNTLSTLSGSEKVIVEKCELVEE